MARRAASKALKVAPEQLPLGTDPRAAPFLKWVGGKRQLVPTIRTLMPKKFGRYLEPFIGGGALFFDVAPDAEKHGPAYLGDINEELLTAYYGVQHHVSAVIELLEGHKVDHALRGKDYYLEVRAQNPKEWSEDTTAARMIYLNKTCYNGLYRVSKKKGTFNVPMGRYENPTILDAAGLKACSDILNRANAQLHHSDFAKVLGIADRGDFVYFDSPYVEVSDTANFKGYGVDGFDDAQQEAQSARRRRSAAASASCSSGDGRGDARAWPHEGPLHPHREVFSIGDGLRTRASRLRRRRLRALPRRLVAHPAGLARRRRALHPLRRELRAPLLGRDMDGCARVAARDLHLHVPLEAVGPARGLSIPGADEGKRGAQGAA